MGKDNTPPLPEEREEVEVEGGNSEKEESPIDLSTTFLAQEVDPDASEVGPVLKNPNHGFSQDTISGIPGR